MTEKKVLEIIEKAAREEWTELDLSFKGIKSLPAEIGQLSNLATLELRDNQLQSLPKEIGQLSNLTKLDLGCNLLASLPAEIGRLVSLKELDLGGEILAKRQNRLARLPREIGQLAKLETLDLGYNQLASLPEEIGKLINLARLNLESNSLASLPTEIGRLKNLTELDLFCNRLTSVPGELGKLTKLKELSLWGNQLGSVPTQIDRLRNLRELDLGSNKLSSLPAEIGRLRNFTTLDLGGNQLDSLPAEIGQLTKLTKLHLHANQLTSLPPEIGDLTNLTELSLSTNKLTSLPAEIEKLRKLRELQVWDNELKELPGTIGNLSKLNEVRVGSNQLTSLPPEIGRLRNLRKIMASKNRLSSLPHEMGDMEGLRELFLSENALTVIPAEIGKLANLRRLGLSHNQLTVIPCEVASLTKLKQLFLGGNPLISPPPDVVEQGTEALLAYLRELAKDKRLGREGKRYEAKLLMLGDGGEGKTCVQRALRGLKFKKQTRTEGVEVVKWTFENPKFRGEKEKEITLNIWDFEGQEINHQAHQFFLTERSLYLLVINGRRQFKMERAEYWLDTIRARAPESRVILVASECENTAPSWPLDKLKAGYGDLLEGENWYFAVGCENGKGVDDLAGEVRKAAADMKAMGALWPASYGKAEGAIRKRSETDAQIERAELYEIFRQSGIGEENFENVAGQMGTLGLITQFRDSPELEDFVVLNPQWLTKGISLVMEDKQLEADKGEIGHERMRQIWAEEYGGLYPVFHSCMKEFELCYDMEDKAGCLVPLRFGDRRPGIPWSEIHGAKERRIEYRLNVRPPKGIMSRFIVKTHYMIAKTDETPKGVYWQNGVFLRTGEGEYRSEALCEFDEGERVMSICVRAAFPQNMVEQLHGVAKAVFSFFEGLKPERKYGCVRFEEREEQCEGAHAERRILFALSRKKEIDCDVGWHVVDPKELVYGFSSFGEGALTVKELREELEKKPKWAEGMIRDVKSCLVWIDKAYDEAVAGRKGVQKLPAEIEQRIKMRLRSYLGMINEMLDNRDFNSAPAVVSIVPVDKSKFNPKNWFEKEYVLTPYCEYEGGVHRVDSSVKFKKSRVWWEKTAPKVAFGVKVLSAGLKIGFAGLPLGVDPKLFDAMKNEVAFMKELAGHLELEGGAESDIGAEAGELVEESGSPPSRGQGVRDLRQVTGEDEKRIVRMQLAQLLEEIAPKEYKARKWGPLRRVRMPDNTYRWLCARHAEEYRR